VGGGGERKSVAAGLEGPGWPVPFLFWEVGTFAIAKLPVLCGPPVQQSWGRN
jgi:hypothetical protein